MRQMKRIKRRSIAFYDIRLGLAYAPLFLFLLSCSLSPLFFRFLLICPTHGERMIQLSKKV